MDPLLSLILHEIKHLKLCLKYVIFGESFRNFKNQEENQVLFFCLVFACFYVRERASKSRQESCISSSCGSHLLDTEDLAG